MGFIGEYPRLLLFLFAIWIIDRNSGRERGTVVVVLLFLAVGYGRGVGVHLFSKPL
jgi:hypothetical protein